MYTSMGEIWIKKLMKQKYEVWVLVIGWGCCTGAGWVYEWLIVVNGSNIFEINLPYDIMMHYRCELPGFARYSLGWCQHFSKSLHIAISSIRRTTISNFKFIHSRVFRLEQLLFWRFSCKSLKIVIIIIVTISIIYKTSF